MNDGVVYLLSYLILPVLLIVVGLVMWRFPPGYGGSVGYRTKRSRSSRQAWDFAQVYWGRLILVMSIPMLAVSVGAGVFQIVKPLSEGAGLLVFCVIMTLQLVPLFVSIGVTESALNMSSETVQKSALIVAFLTFSFDNVGTLVLDYLDSGDSSDEIQNAF